MNKTCENTIQRTRSNSSSRRTVENFLSFRTVNPSALNPISELLLIRDEGER